MKNKKANYALIGVVIILGVIAFTLLILNSPNFQKFDPEKHICEIKIVTNNELINLAYEEEGYADDIIGMNPHYVWTKECGSWRLKTFCEKCEDDWDYTEKEGICLVDGFNMCERIITCEEECICEKWEQKEMIRIDVTYWVTDIDGHYATLTFDFEATTKEYKIPIYYKYPENAEYNVGAIDLDSFVIGSIFENRMVDEKCLKAREKTECEKGNQNYVWDEQPKIDTYIDREEGWI